jgi:hypothetical protein
LRAKRPCFALSATAKGLRGGKWGGVVGLGGVTKPSAVLYPIASAPSPEQLTTQTTDNPTRSPDQPTSNQPTADPSTLLFQLRNSQQTPKLPADQPW